MDRQINQDHSLQEITPETAPIAVIGFSHAAFHTVCRLAEQGQRVQFLVNQSELHQVPTLPAGVELSPRPHLHPAELPEDLRNCERAVVASDNEQFNLHTTMMLNARYPQMRIVTRLFNLALGQEIESRFPHVRVLSVSELAAPYFVAAAFVDHVQEAWHDQEHLMARVGADSSEKTLCIQVEDFPAPQSLASMGAAAVRHKPDLLFWAVLVGLLGVIASGTLFFSLRHGMPLGDALYFVVTTLTTTGYGDYSLRDYPFSAKLAGMSLMLAGASLFAILYALLTDKLFSLRLDALMGRRQVKASGHVIVCGAGDVGVRLVECLRLTQAETVVVEHNSEGRFNQRIRDLHYPLLIADATLEETLIRAGVKRARTLICATHQDLVNIEIALNARALNPAIRIVVRIYERDFAEHMREHFGIDVALSSSALASHAFAREAMKDIEI
ncbi:hypothetical protein COW36_17760 [bacterium (Candidatus Blackallbacteria) CG17_big_fil_post_rev_8_21_14_2_50_48_46]|uniref:RCK N-terminal domain-containing protein n=1 Tax=bacterium (Candidatus Blackallbacteria) CG17_big_fil_post_rev_8_21_14_2_50_48_46 TaxID=2014261 RepID=A0A2M7G0W6_9BACT|nr:MAG: hypothetical protein COW64_00965 [bacterium (Candidatus Blackallbacteria) CG18_big_fil_WC_8_21_14_2_50_49_26]PIW15263.1 MAG: hypothetical protein COW36_17760 [bacterium (Candidatus Blackallbacteria) CG17_big_fil_post_rev_8_21_14_2_50_48_46]PIW45228.1 MAG: hypothetical protein COW20_21255 [bacterium (Candidatus Blackallbacteria) CG13_big_fil_rev_8_21_14_2_50_49_14]